MQLRQYASILELPQLSYHEIGLGSCPQQPRVVLNGKQNSSYFQASDYAFKTIKLEERFLARDDPEIQQLATTHSNYPKQS